MPTGTQDGRRHAGVHPVCAHLDPPAPQRICDVYFAFRNALCLVVFLVVFAFLYFALGFFLGFLAFRAVLICDL